MYDMCAQTVKIDLPKLNRVLRVATATLHDCLQGHLASVNEDLRSASVAAIKGVIE